MSLFFFSCPGDTRDLHSFPTRRSSDLKKNGVKDAFKHFYRTKIRRFPYLEKVYRSLPQSLKDRKSTRLNSSHLGISYAVFCLKKKKYTDKTKIVTVLQKNRSGWTKAQK